MNVFQFSVTSEANWTTMIEIVRSQPKVTSHWSLIGGNMDPGFEWTRKSSKDPS